MNDSSVVKRKYCSIPILLFLSFLLVFPTTTNAEEKPPTPLLIGIKNQMNSVISGQTGELEYYFTTVPEISAKGNVQFTSSNPDVLSIDNDGKWIALKPGETIIYFKVKLNEESERKFLEKYSYADVPETYSSFFHVAVTSEFSYVYRLYNMNSGEHFYTTDILEKDSLTKLSWVDEGVAWNSYKGQERVYRLYNPNTGDHHFTTDRPEVDFLISKGWVDEGVAFYSLKSGTESIYRLYNPNASVGTHHLTKSNDERQQLISSGWIDEGIAWYEK